MRRWLGISSAVFAGTALTAALAGLTAAYLQAASTARVLRAL